MPDYLQIGGSSGLDTTNMMVTDSVCGQIRGSSKLKNNTKSVEQRMTIFLCYNFSGASEETIACGVTTVRLVSSGNRRNVVQVAIRPAEEEELFSASFMCPA